MILELRKSCIQTIERTLSNINQFKMQCASSLPKQAQQKVHSIQNDLQLLKDNFTLIVTKVIRLQSKCSERQMLAQKVQHNYRVKYQQVCQAYKILEVKHQKLGKQLNFIKFSNNSLRNQLHSIKNKSVLNDKLKKGIQQIQRLISNNSQDLQNKINRIIASIHVEKDYQAVPLENSFQRKLMPSNSAEKKNAQNKIFEISEFSLQKPPIKEQMQLRQQKPMINSCELKGQKDSHKTKKKTTQKNIQMEQIMESLSTDKKKRSQLAKIVEQQGRLAKINERYLSTDIF